MHYYDNYLFKLSSINNFHDSLLFQCKIIGTYLNKITKYNSSTKIYFEKYWCEIVSITDLIF